MSPALIVAVQLISYFMEAETFPVWFFMLIAWTNFALWVRFLLMLRSKKRVSKTISMVLKSFETMGAYLVIVFLGVLAFSNVFMALR